MNRREEIDQQIAELEAERDALSERPDDGCFIPGQNEVSYTPIGYTVAIRLFGDREAAREIAGCGESFQFKENAEKLLASKQVRAQLLNLAWEFDPTPVSGGSYYFYVNGGGEIACAKTHLIDETTKFTQKQAKYLLKKNPDLILQLLGVE